MKKNMGTIDRVIRSLIAIVIAILFFTHTISGTLAYCFVDRCCCIYLLPVSSAFVRYTICLD